MAKCYAISVQSCRVWFRDSQSVEHGVYVQAYNRFHAFGLAMYQMRRCSWANADYRGVQQMTVELLEKSSPTRRIVVTREAFETWLVLKTGSDRDQKLRKHLRILLGREEPDRDYKRFTEIR